jgi:hypothetical protein
MYIRAKMRYEGMYDELAALFGMWVLVGVG